jgi:osmotically-inducible protein OsmY
MMLPEHKNGSSRRAGSTKIFIRDWRRKMNNQVEDTANCEPRPKGTILEEIWSKLWQVDTIRFLDLDHINYEVNDSEVLLTGHLSKSSHLDLVEVLVQEIRGVRAVRNELVVDRDLTLEVAHALAVDPRTRPFRIQVGATHGWIHLNGEVPSEEDCMAVEEVAACVPQVRGIVTLPEVHGRMSIITRRPLQPQIGARVYSKNGQFGKVVEVVFCPRNRLVSHLIVDARFETSSGYEAGTYVIPIDFVEYAKSYNVFLRGSIQDLIAESIGEPEDFPVAPGEWRPPFPYNPQGLRWSDDQGYLSLARTIEARSSSQAVHRV